ncbi:hypothetical protein Sango_1890200 [Sesamum angolense]|uniref:Uncharacterized protein n=1 Tax=Sesamum angolense TaxID=2727404 RepID=A0AAE1WIY1_9LAMI|nr:hypothetical protein Sango_1890200 [Sesamum angolense]
MYLEKYIVGVMDLTLEPGCWPTKPCEQGTSGPTMKQDARELIRLCITPSSQWTGGGQKLNIGRRNQFGKEDNVQLLEEHLDLVDELREMAFARMQRYKSITKNAHNRRVKARHFKVGDLVLRKGGYLEAGRKIGSQMGRTNKVTKIIGKGAYELEDEEERILNRPWNIHNLRKFYP